MEAIIQPPLSQKLETPMQDKETLARMRFGLAAAFAAASEEERNARADDLNALADECWREGRLDEFTEWKMRNIPIGLASLALELPSFTRFHLPQVCSWSYR